MLGFRVIRPDFRPYSLYNCTNYRVSSTNISPPTARREDACRMRGRTPSLCEVMQGEMKPGNILLLDQTSGAGMTRPAGSAAARKCVTSVRDGGHHLDVVAFAAFEDAIGEITQSGNHTRRNQVGSAFGTIPARRCRAGRVRRRQLREGHVMSPVVGRESETTSP
jgi:hypothetical protein